MSPILPTFCWGLRIKREHRYESIFFQKSKEIRNVRLLLILIYEMVRNILETPSGEDFMNFKSANPASHWASPPHPSSLCRDEYQTFCFQGAWISIFDCFTHFTTIGFPFCSRKKHKAEAKMHPWSFTNYISFDLIIQVNSIKLLELVFCTAI